MSTKTSKIALILLSELMMIFSFHDFAVSLLFSSIEILLTPLTHVLRDVIAADSKIFDEALVP